MPTAPTGLALPGYHDRDLGPNAALQHLREVELTPRRGAPFSGDRLQFLDECDRGTWPRSGRSLGLIDVPITQIAGIANSGNLHHFVRGMTFGEVLFHCLHGASLNQDSLDYLCGDAVKSKDYEGYEPFPQIWEVNRNSSKYLAKHDMTFTRVHGLYFADQGQQRAIFARYAIFQRFGLGGALRNVHVFDATP